MYAVMDINGVILDTHKSRWLLSEKWPKLWPMRQTPEGGWEYLSHHDFVDSLSEEPLEGIKLGLEYADRVLRLDLSEKLRVNLEAQRGILLAKRKELQEA